jgi:hypothetical protein
MSLQRLGYRKPLSGLVVLMFLALAAQSAWAEATTTICVPERASTSLLSTNTKGECPAKVINKVTVNYKSEPLPGKTELEKLDKLLPHVNFVESGVAGKPTIQFSGVNVQVVSGAGKTNAAVNGEGNLVIGYDENKEGKHLQTGSHDLLLGEEQSFTSFGGIVGGYSNTISGEFASVTSGDGNTASGKFSSVSGSASSTASEVASSVSGGVVNKASGINASVSGGSLNTASGARSSVSAGEHNTASGESSWVGGGQKNTAKVPFASVSGGQENTASGNFSSVSGGFFNSASGEFASLSGGSDSIASAASSSIDGGLHNHASAASSWIGGGDLNSAEGFASSIFGGKELKATHEYEAIP